VTPTRRVIRPGGARQRRGRAAGARARTALVALLALAAAGCQTLEDAGTELFPEGDSMEAVMAPIGGSAVSGSVVIGPTKSGVAMRIYLTGMPLLSYRVVIHTNGNCSSPNGFSAGPPLKLPGAADHVLAGVVPAYPIKDNALTLVLRVPGIHLEGPNGIAGRSVVIHAPDDGSLEAQPGVPNNRVACGVIAKVRPLSF
jgi:superoxide dismutase, Cu-Zn family